MVLLPDRFVPAVSLLDDLEYVRRWPREHWQLAFQGQLRTVSGHDAELLRKRLAQARDEAPVAPAKVGSA